MASGSPFLYLPRIWNGSGTTPGQGTWPGISHKQLLKHPTPTFAGLSFFSAAIVSACNVSWDFPTTLTKCLRISSLDLLSMSISICLPSSEGNVLVKIKLLTQTFLGLTYRNSTWWMVTVSCSWMSQPERWDSCIEVEAKSRRRKILHLRDVRRKYCNWCSRPWCSASTQVFPLREIVLFFESVIFLSWTALWNFYFTFLVISRVFSWVCYCD